MTSLISKVISSKSKKESDLQPLFPREQHRRRELKYLQELSECLLLMEKTWSCESNEKQQQDLSIIEFDLSSPKKAALSDSSNQGSGEASESQDDQYLQRVDYIGEDNIDYHALKQLVARLSTIKSHSSCSQPLTSTNHIQVIQTGEDTGKFEDYNDIIDLTSGSLLE